MRARIGTRSGAGRDEASPPSAKRQSAAAATRALRALTAAIRAVGDATVIGLGSSDPGSAVRSRWNESLRPETQVLWIEHRAARDDWVQPLPPIESVIADGLVMAHVAVRLSIKNRVLVDALRDHVDFDREAVEGFAQSELLRLADESEQTATRLEPIVSALTTADRPSLVEQVERDGQVRRPAVHRGLAAALQAAAQEEHLLTTLVEQSVGDAADELAIAVAVAVPLHDVGQDRAYAALRDRRIRDLIRKDLRRLEQRPHSVPLSRPGPWLSTRYP